MKADDAFDVRGFCCRIGFADGPTSGMCEQVLGDARADQPETEIFQPRNCLDQRHRWQVSLDLGWPQFGSWRKSSISTLCAPISQIAVQRRSINMLWIVCDRHPV